MVHVMLTIPKPSVWSMENIVNTFLRSIEREQIGLRTVIHYMLGLTMAWFLNTMGPDSLINMWSLTILNFFFSLIVNVEISARLETVKYLSKYIYKGPDRATMEISSGMQNEIKAHLDSCFIGPMEACWKIFEFNIHGESLAVQHLPIYLPNEHYVNFYAHQTINKVLAKQNMEKTQLTAWFDYNSVHDDGLGLTYWQFPQYYTWNAKVKSWHPRQRAKVIGRIYFVSPSKREQFFL